MISMQGSCPFLAAHMQREDLAPSSEDYVLEEDRPYRTMLEASRMVRAASTEDLRSDADGALIDASWQQIERQSGPAQGFTLPARPGRTSPHPASGEDRELWAT